MKTKVLIITGSYPPFVGGASTYFSSIISHFKKNRKIEIHLLTVKRKKDRPHCEKINNNIYIHRDINNFEEYKINLIKKIYYFFYSVFFSFKETINLDKKYNFNVIHVHFSLGFGYGSTLAAKLIEKKMVWDIRDILNNVLLMRCLLLIKKPDATVICSQNTEEFVREKIKYKGKILNVSVIPFFENKEVTIKRAPSKIKRIYKKLENRKDKKVFLFIGKLEKRKGIMLLLKAIDRIIEKKKNAYLLIAGEGSCRSKVKENVEKYPNNIFFLGRVKHYFIPLIYKMSDFFVLPSLSEGSPRSIQEALYFGKFVIANNVGDIKQYVNKRNGILIEDLNEKSLSQAMYNVLKIKKIIIGNKTNFKDSKFYLKEMLALKNLYHQISEV